MKTVALLPLKANSDRVVGKNFRDFCGKPLFFWILDTLLSLPELDSIVINTDARSLLMEAGLVEGGKVIIRDRAPELCGDHVSMNLIIADDIAAISADRYVMTHATNPLLTVGTIEKALNKFDAGVKDDGADSLFTVSKVQTRFYRADGSPVNHDPDKLIPTQEIEPWYEENSALYIFTRQSFAATGARIGARPMMFESAAFESIDIDTPQDWDFAVAAERYMQAQKEGEL